MNPTILLSVINAKYVHAASAPWCLAAGVKAYAPELYEQLAIRDFKIKVIHSHHFRGIFFITAGEFFCQILQYNFHVIHIPLRFLEPKSGICR